MNRGGTSTRGNSTLNLSQTIVQEAESQAKFCENRVSNIEKNYGNICQTLGSITRKAARQRDKGDLLSKQLVEYSKTEDVSHSMKAGLYRCAENMSAIQDYREAEIHRLESKVVQPLCDYGNICKSMKKKISQELGNIKKEQKTIQQLEKVRSKNPGDQHQIHRAESEVSKAKSEAENGSKALEDQMMIFEKNRLDDLKNYLADFINIEMIFHARALEYYAKCFENVVMIDIDRDLAEFKRKMVAAKGGQVDLAQSFAGMSTGSSTMGSETLGTGSSYTYTYGDNSAATTSGTDKRVRISNTSMMYGEDDDDDEDDDDYEEEAYSVPRRTGMR